MPKSVRVVLRSLISMAVAVGLMTSLPMVASAVQPPDNSHADPNAFGGTNKFGYVPGLGEYRVHSTVILDLGPGVSGGVQRDPDVYRCVNANGEFPFRTTNSVPQVHDLWMDVSMSVVPPCFQSKSFAYFNVYVDSPYRGNFEINFNEVEDGKPTQSPYMLTCLDGVYYHLACHQNNDLSVTITCKDEPNAPCPRRDSPAPFPIPDLGSTG